MNPTTDRESLVQAIARRQARDRGMRRRILAISLAMALLVHVVVLGLVLPGLDRFVYSTLGSPATQPAGTMPLPAVRRDPIMVDWNGILTVSAEPQPDFSLPSTEAWPDFQIQPQLTKSWSYPTPFSSFRIALPPPPRRDITDDP